MPVIPMKDQDWVWYNKAKDFYSQPNAPTKGIITKCPAIGEVHKTGWIMRAYTDIHITRNDVLARDQYGTVTDEILEGHTNGAKEYGGTGVDWFMHNHELEFHSIPQMSIFRTLHPRTNGTVIKFANPWFATVPRGYSLWLMPIPYPDNCMFQTSIGTIRGTNWLNLQLFWHAAGLTGFIQKGTPLSYMILVKDEKHEYEIEALDGKEAVEWLRTDYYKFGDQYTDPKNESIATPPEEVKNLLPEEKWKHLTKSERKKLGFK